MSIIKLAGGSGIGFDMAVDPPRSGDSVRKVSPKEIFDGNRPVDQHEKPHANIDAESSKEEDKKLFEAIIDEIRQELKVDERQVEFSYKPDVREMVVTVKDKTSGNIIRQIPEEYVLKIMEKFQISGKIEGLLINDKV